MTIICAMLDVAANGCWIASDRLATAGTGVVGYREKWLLGDGFAIGSSGYGVMLDELVAVLDEFNKDMHPAQMWARAVRIMKEAGWKPRTNDGEPPFYECGFLFATKTNLWSIDGTGSSTPFGFGEFASRGSGADVADGAMHALSDHARDRMTTEEMMRATIDAAIAYDTGCGGEPFVRFIG